MEKTDETKLIEDLKSKHGKVTTVTFENEDEKELTVYLKKMGRSNYSSITALIQKFCL